MKIKILQFLFGRFAKIIYFLGKNEEQKKEQLTYQQQATIGNKVLIETGTIINNQLHDKSKILIGDNSWLNKAYLTIFGHGGQIIIGNNTFIGPNSCIWSAAKITIGNYVLISHNVNIHDNNSHSISHIERQKDFDYIRANGKLQSHNSLSEQEVVIKDNVWIGFNAVILKGVTIGEGAIIGANTLITKDVPAYAIVVGNPATVIGKSN